MKRPHISFVVPTFDPNRPLDRTIESIVHQLLPGDELLVVGDATEGSLPHAERCCTNFQEQGFEVQYLEYNSGHHCFGHCCINYAFDNASGDLLCVNDDDDIWTSTAAFDIRCAAIEYPSKPLLFRFISYNNGIIWKEKGIIQRDRLGGHNLIQPNIPTKIGKMTCAYNGDFDMIHRCLMLHGGYESAIWVDKVIAIARP